MEATQLIFNQIMAYINGLDWNYILTFILIMYGINYYKVRMAMLFITRVKLRTRYRALLVGTIYGTLVYFIRGYTLDKVELLFRSFVFALVFHKLIVQSFLLFMAERFLPQSLNRHRLKQQQYESLISGSNEPGK